MKLVTLIGTRTDWSSLGALLAAPSLAVRVLQNPASGLVPAILDTTDVFVLDIDCDEMSAADFIRAVLTIRPTATVIVAAECRHPDRLTVLESGAAGLLRAPIDALELVAAVHGAFKRSSGSAIGDILDELPVKIALVNRQDEILFANRQAAKFWRSAAGTQHKLPERDAAWLADIERHTSSGGARAPSHVALTGSSGRPSAHLALVASAPSPHGAADTRLVLAVPAADVAMPDARDDVSRLLAELDQVIRAVDSRRQVCALHVVHVGGLAETNRTYGRIIGDRMMEGLLQRLVALASSRDLLVGRLAGDEFVVLQSAGQPQDVQSLAAEIIGQAGQALDCAGQRLEPRISLGVSVSPRDGTDAASLVRVAKQALLQARSATGNVPIAYSSPQAVRPPVIEVDQAFRQTLETDQLEFFYQPQVNLRTGRYDGVEALLRWSRGDQGDIPPRDILAVAERQDLLDALTAWICRRLDEDRMRLRDAELPVMRLSLHFSAEQLALPNLPAHLGALRAVAKEDIDILLTSEMLAKPGVDTVLNHLRKLGIGLCLRLSAAEMEQPKVPALISSLKIDARDEARLETVLRYARARALPVIGGNIEEATQLVALRERNGETAQGYYIQAPVSLTEMISILRSDLLP